MNPKLAALAEGQLRYFTGRLCRKGHMSERYTSNGMCVKCIELRAEEHRTMATMHREKRRDAHNKNMIPFTVTVRYGERSTVLQLCDILQYASPHVVEALKVHMQEIHSDPSTYT